MSKESPDAPANKSSKVPGTALLSKALNILECIGETDARLRINDVVEATGYAKPTTYRILAALTARGFIQVDPRDHAYGLGPRFTELAGAIAQHSDLISISAAPLKRLADKYGEVASLGVLAGNSQQTIAASNGVGVINPSSLGTRKPLYCTALGKALLAFQDQSVQNKLMREMSYERLTPFTIHSEQGLRAELDIIRRRGFAHDNEEIVEDVKCVAVPILDNAGKSVAAISVSAPAHRMTEQRRNEIAVDVLNAAKEIGQLLSGNNGQEIEHSQSANWLTCSDGINAFGINKIEALSDGTLILCDGPGGMILKVGDTPEKLLALNHPIKSMCLTDNAVIFASQGALWRMDPQDSEASAIKLAENSVFDLIDSLVSHQGKLFAGCGAEVFELNLEGGHQCLAGGRRPDSGLKSTQDGLIFVAQKGISRLKPGANAPTELVSLPVDGIRDFAIEPNGTVWIAREAAWGIEQFDAGGKLKRKVPLPIPNVSSLSFTEKLQIGTERWPLSSAQLDLAPASGSLFSLSISALPEIAES